MRKTRRSHGFTLVELLVVIGIIALLIGILIPALSKAQQQARVTACLSNLRQLTTAWLNYANEFKGNLAFAETGSVDDPTNVDKRDGWVVDVPGDPANNTRAAIEKGLLWKYAPAAETYRCPSSFDLANYRSYSINSHLNGSPTLWYPTYYTTGVPPGSPPISLMWVTKLNKVKTTRVVFIEEYDERGFNRGSFFQFWVDPRDTSQRRWQFGDVPAFFHKKGTALSFADGHAEFRIWKDARTLQAQRAPAARGTAPFQQGNNELLELRKLMYGP
jgi:prepilin-type N-terminal cleavage/methylation domain-containing protein